MTEQILDSFKRDIESLTLVPHEGGRFEVSLDGELVYSKLETGSFPDPKTILGELRKRLG